LLLRERVEAVHDLGAWHQQLRRELGVAQRIATEAIAREQARQARYYDRKARGEYQFEERQLVWVYQPPRGPGITKLRHQWLGPCRVMESAGYDNFRVKRLDGQGELLAHMSLLLPFNAPASTMDAAAADLEHEWFEGLPAPASGSTEEAGATAPARVARARWEPEAFLRRTAGGVFFKEYGRRVRRNPAGRYEVELDVEVLSGRAAGERRWLTLEEYEQLWVDGRDVGDDVENGPGE
jgi:hypothetical protein